MEYATVQGEAVPKIGLGTWKLSGETCRQAVESALELGYRHVDTAEAYGNERAVGAAIEASDVDREDVFLTTKVFARNARYDDVLVSAEASLDRLGVDQVDLLLLHWPNPLVDVADTMQALSELRAAGKTRHVGVSNFGLSRFGLGNLRTAMAESAVPVFADQVQFHVYRHRKRLLEFCREEDVLLTAYSPLVRGGVLDDRELRAVGAKHDKTAAQVALRWVIQHENVVAIPKATSRSHQAENFDVFDFELSPAEVERVGRSSWLRTGAAWVRGQLGV